MKNRWQRSMKIKKSDKSRERKVRNRTNVGGWTEANVATAGGSTEARRKDENGCTEVRNGQEVPAIMHHQKLTYDNLKSRDGNTQTTELTTFRPDASSFKKNERQYEKASESIKKKGESEVWKIGDSEVWKLQKWQKPVEKGEKADERRWLNRRQSLSGRRQHRSTQKRREWLQRSAQQTRSSRIYAAPKVLTYDNLKNNRR